MPPVNRGAVQPIVIIVPSAYILFKSVGGFGALAAIIVADSTLANDSPT